MSKLRVNAFTVSADGFGAGPDQSRESPLGRGAGLIDELHIAVSPILLGRGEPLFDGIDFTALGYSVKECALTESAMHLVLGR